MRFFSPTNYNYDIHSQICKNAAAYFSMTLSAGFPVVTFLFNVVYMYVVCTLLFSALLDCHIFEAYRQLS